MTKDFFILTILGVIILVLTPLLEIGTRYNVLPQWLSRKLLHIIAISTCAFAPALLHDLTLLTGVVASIEPLLIFLVATGRLFGEAGGRKSWGIALFPLAYGSLLLLFADQRWLIVVPMAILAWSDAAAAIFGHLFAQQYYTLTGDRKSWIGSAAFVVSVPAVVALIFAFFPTLFSSNFTPNLPFWWGLLAIALLLASLEALGSNGFDNVWVPLGAAFLLQPLFENVKTWQVITLWIGIFFAWLFCYYTLRKKALTLDGAITASLLGLWVLWLAGAVWLIPLFFFFITSTLLSRLAKRRASAADAKHGKARDYVQVLCNGGMYGALATFSHSAPAEFIFILMLISMAVCTADTWASEIGIYFRWRTYDILRFRALPVGLSGGISLPGTLGGLAGAFALAIIGSLLLYNDLQWNSIAFIALSGFSGMLLDSLLGAAGQARYKNLNTNALSDSADENSLLQSGWRWMSNDAVNLISNLLIIAIAALLLNFFP